MALNLDDAIARIERQQAETRKFVAEQHKLAAEAGSDSWLLFLSAVLAGVVWRLPEILQALGWAAR